MPTAYDRNYFYTEAQKANQSTYDKLIADNNTLYSNQANSINEIYDTYVSNTKKNYEDNYRENAIQKLINERQVAENMANLGLTNSGLNRTQQTAVQLSYANAKANIDKQKQSAIDSYELERTNKLSSNEQSRLSSEAQITQEYNELINETADTNYNNYLTYLAEQEKIAKQNSYIIKTNNGLLSRDFTGSLKDNRVDCYKITKDYVDYIRYVDNNSGNSVELRVGVNPYTGDDNTTGDSDTAKAYKAYNAFENGYQPKGVYFNGKDYGWVSHSGLWDEINGNMQRVHQTEDGSLWIWDGKENKYKQYSNKDK